MRAGFKRLSEKYSDSPARDDATGLSQTANLDGAAEKCSASRSGSALRNNLALTWVDITAKLIAYGYGNLPQKFAPVIIIAWMT